MRAGVLVMALIFILYDWGGHRIPATSAASTASNSSDALAVKPDSETSAPESVDFDSQIKPILQSRCMPCHFSGGTMYERLPFDRPETIKKLGTKLFTRIHDENHRRLIREFLAQDQ